MSSKRGSPTKAKMQNKKTLTNLFYFCHLINLFFASPKYLINHHNTDHSNYFHPSPLFADLGKT